VRRAASPRLSAYAALVAIGLVAALALGRAELAVLAAPFALLLALGIAAGRAPSVTVATWLSHERALEGDEVEATLELVSQWPLDRLELFLALPAGVETADPNPRAVRWAADESRRLTVTLACAHWGGYVLGDVYVRARDRLGIYVYEGFVRGAAPLKVYPQAERLRVLLPPLETQVFVGNQVSRTRGDGIEFADLRAFTAGDQRRRINWRASARRGGLWVNERHPERNADVVVFLDTFGEASRGGRGTLDTAVRAAAAIVDRYFRRRDRIGLVSFGGSLRWLFPASGIVQLYRVVDALVDTEIVLSYTWRGVDVIPRRTLTPKALVIALTPLLDERAVGALLDLRARGFDLVVVDVSPVGFVDPGRDERERLGHRLWLLRRDALRAQYERVGVPVVEWREGVSLEQALEEVAGFRRHAGWARA
jgi:uncharacterized protein (DUF58 family)